MTRRLAFLLGIGAAVATLAPPLTASNHREAPITALDHKADITDLYAFMGYGAGSAGKLTIIMGVDPLLDTANGPNWFPFDDEILYELKIDNDHDAREDITLQFRFDIDQRLPSLFQVYAGADDGYVAPSNSPAPVPPGTLIVPPRITSLDSPGLGQRQRYSVTAFRGSQQFNLRPVDGRQLQAVPANVGPRTMDYQALFTEGVYTLPSGIRTFAGTTDDAFWIDLGAAFDTFNLRSSVAPGVLSPTQDAANENFSPDTVSGYGVNTIAIEIPVNLLTRSGQVEPATSPGATLGIWGTTSRPRISVRRNNNGVPDRSGLFRQVQRVGNPLINELIIGTGSKDRFSMDLPANDAQFVGFFADPALPRVLNALTGGVLAIPPAPRLDLRPLVQYVPPIAAAGTPMGPIADVLRINTGVPPTPPGSASRLGVLGGDNAGFPNGRRVFDDVTDIALRVVAGGVLAAPFPGFNADINGRLGDGVNVNDAPYLDDFPYVGLSPSGRDRRHIDPTEPGCTAGGGAPCPGL
ncbi:MAG: DUF4331 domain-containing protein [Vicinamibacterales bacterium]